MDNPLQVDRSDLIQILDNFGKQVCESKKQFLSSIVTYTSFEGSLTDLTLYILAPEISYEYRVISVEYKVTKLKIRFFTIATKESEHFYIDISNGTSSFQNKLNEIQNLGLFKAALEHLVIQILLKREYKISPIKNKIIPGQAKVAILHNGQKINAGWIRFDEDEYVVYYTGQGLREMWKPNMTPQEQARANELKQKKETELIEKGMIARRKISDFLDVL